MTTGIAYYDLSRSPPTYDFLSFLIGAEMDRLGAGWDDFEVHVLPGPKDGFRADNLPPFAAHERERMLRGIVMAMPILMPTCGGIIRHAERSQAVPGSIGWGQGRYGFARKVQAARRDIYPLRPLLGFRTPKAPYATITLRECQWWPSRNSTIGQWLAVADGLKARGITPVFIRDTSRAEIPVNGFPTDGNAAADLHTRAAFYANAVMNLFVNNGPAWLSWFMAAPTLICKMVSADAPAVSPGFFEAAGLKPGENMPNARPRQRLLWTDDRCELILAAFDEMMAA